MTLDDFKRECDAAEAQTRDPVARAGFAVVLPRRAGGGRRMRVAPGLMGELLCENSEGRAVVRVTCADVRRWLARVSS